MLRQSSVGLKQALRIKVVAHIKAALEEDERNTLFQSKVLRARQREASEAP